MDLVNSILEEIREEAKRKRYNALSTFEKEALALRVAITKKAITLKNGDPLHMKVYLSAN